LRSPPQRASPITADPGFLTLCVTLLGSLSVCYRGYLFYSVALRGSVGYSAIEDGTASAPEQYRIGVVRTAYWMLAHLHLRLSRGFGVLDFLGSTLAVLLLYRVFRLSPVFRRSTPELRWIGSAAFAAMILFYLNWTLWYQKIATLPTAGLVALMLWLCTPNPQEGEPRPSQWAAGLGFLAIVAIQSFIRADVALFLCVGLFLVSLTRAGHHLALSRNLARAVGIAGSALAGGIQLYLMKVLYPNATYGDVPVYMILHDYKVLTLWFAFFIFIAPFAWTVYQVFRRRFGEDAAGVGFMLAAIGYIGIWVALGRLDEVRIFIPLGLSLVPLLAQMLILHVQAPPPRERREVLTP
jgi:uncharacterized membrane protein